MLLTLEETNDIVQSIADVYGYNIVNYDRVFVQKRLHSFAVQQKCHDFVAVKQCLLADELLLRDFINGMLVNVSEMFRDPQVFAMLRTDLLPYIASYPVIKIWSAGCAYGQEVYSLAILLTELGLYDRCVLYATDINPEAIKRAKAGVYAIADAVKFAENYYLSGGCQKFSDYFTFTKDCMTIKPSLRKNICFAHHNMISDTRFNAFSLILCRNMLIYFDAQLQQRALKLFSSSLENNGFLVLGKAESLVNNSGYKYFADYNLANRIFKPH